MQFLARKYRYADGVIYNPNRYNVFDNSDPNHPIRLGGALVLKGKAIAFVGHPGYGHSVDKIVKGAQAYAWGTTLADALTKIRPALEMRIYVMSRHKPRTSLMCPSRSNPYDEDDGSTELQDKVLELLEAAGIPTEINDKITYLIAEGELLAAALTKIRPALEMRAS